MTTSQAPTRLATVTGDDAMTDGLVAGAFVVSAAFVLYTYAGYPALVLGLQRLGVRYGPVRADSGEALDADLPPVAVIVVVHDAADLVERKLASILVSDYPADKLQVLVFSDGSGDGTDARVQALADTDTRIRLLRGEARRGKAACLNDAVQACGAPVLVMTDVRQLLDKLALRRLATHFIDDAVGAVSGALDIAVAGPTSAFAADAVVSSAGDYWRMEKKLRAAEADIHSAIGVTGALYALRRSAFVPIPAQTILDDVLIPMNAVLAGYRVLFDANARAFDAPSRSEAQEVQRKIRTLAGSFQLPALRPALLAPWRNPVWWQFVSHKLARVFAPFAFFVALVASLWLAQSSPLFALLAGLQLVGYAIAVWPAGSSSFWSLRFVRLIRGFIRLQWCAVLGLVWFVRNPAPQLWQTTQHGTTSGGTMRGDPGR